jgi:putative membrane protein
LFTSLAAAPLAVGALAHGGPIGFAFLPFFLIGHVFFFLLIVFIIVFAIAGRRRRWARFGAGGGMGPFGDGHFGQWGQASRAAETTLAERFAQGDIDEKEYRARLEVLRANNAPQSPMK